VKSLLFFSIPFFIIFSWLWLVNTQAATKPVTQSGPDFVLSPESLERFHNQNVEIVPLPYPNHVC
jgi:hypothetical protein